MFHSELYSSSIASGANTFAQVTGIFASAILAAQNNGFTVVHELPFLSQVMGVGAHLVHVRPQSNSMLPAPYTAISPNNRGTAFESPPRYFDLSRNPMPLRPAEEIDCFATQNAGAGETQYILFNFSDGIQQPVAYGLNTGGVAGASTLTPGRAFTVHATGTTTLSAGAWTQVSLTFDQALPAGTYAVIGMRAFSATALFARLAPVTGIKYRPGAIAVQAYDQMDCPFQRMIVAPGIAIAPMGEWIRFYQNVPPKIDFFATAGDNAEEVWLDLVFISAAAMPLV